MSDVQRAPSVGATGGLPGTNAAPQTREPSQDDLDLVQSGDLRTTPTDPVADRDADDPVDEQDADPRGSDYTGGPDPSSHAHELAGWGGNEPGATLSPEQAGRLQQHEEPVAAGDFGAALHGDLGNAADADETGDAPETREPDTSLGHEGGVRYRDGGGVPD